MKKVGVIGIGHVGSHIVRDLLFNDLISDIYIYDINYEYANAQIKDLHQASLLHHNVNIKYTSVEEFSDLDIIINTASGKISSSDRLDELKSSKEIIYNIFKDFNTSKFKGIIINVTNPCDIVTYIIQKVTNINPSRVIGTGTLLDSLRFKEVLSEKLNCNPTDLFCYNIGEHGPSIVNIYSNIKLNNKLIGDFFNEEEKKEIDSLVIKAGFDIFKVKNCTEFGIAASTALIVKAILNNEDLIIPFSHYYFYNDDYIYISTLARINKDGYIEDENIKLDLNSDELDKFNLSCLKIKNIINNLL